MFPPSRPLTVDRPHLYRQIGTPGIDMAPLVILKAPLGYGKTILIEQWLNAQYGAGMLEPEMVKRIGSESWFDQRELLTWMESRAGPSVVVIDDYQQATCAKTDGHLLRLLEAYPNLYLLVSSRRFVMLDGPVTAARISLTVLRADDLSLSKADLGNLVSAARSRQATSQKNARNRTPVVMPRTLRDRTAGWPLVIGQIVNRNGASLKAGGISGESIFSDFVAGLVASPLEWRVLDAISQLPQISCRVLGAHLSLERHELEKSLERLEDSGLIEGHHRGARVRFACRPGVRAVVQSLLGHEEGQVNEELLEAHADDLEATSPIEAAEIFLRLGKLGKADRIVRHHYSYFMMSPESTQRVLDYPLEELLEYPLLIGAKAMVMRADLEVSPEDIDRTLKTLRKAAHGALRDAEGFERVQNMSLVIAMERMIGDWDESLRQARELELLLGRHVPRDQRGSRSSFPVVYAIIGLTGILMGDLALARRSATRAYDIATVERNPVEVVRACYQLALLEAYGTDVERVNAYLAEADRIIRKTGVKAPELSWANERLAQMMVAYHLGDTDFGLEIADSLAPYVERIEQWPIFMITKSVLLHQKFGAEVAFRTMAQGMRNPPRGRTPAPFHQSMMLVLAANLAMYSGHLGMAEQLLDRASEGTWARIARGRLYLLRGRYSEAVRLIEKYIQGAVLARPHHHSLLIGIIAAHRNGEPERCKEWLEMLLPLISYSGAENHLNTVPITGLREVAEAYPAIVGERFVRLLDDIPEERRFVEYEPLTAAESRTLQAMVKGLSTAQIADRLFISANTVKFHLRGIYQKLGVKTRKQALERARQLGLV